MNETFVLTGCGEYTLQENSNSSVLKATGEQIEDLLLAAKKAGVTATDLQKLGLE